jgi:hypothetical protein
MMPNAGYALVACSVVLLSACSGNDGENVELKREALREIGLLANILTPGSALLGSPDSVARSPFNTKLGIMPASECTDGEADATSGEAPRSLEFFVAGSSEAEYQRTVFVECGVTIEPSSLDAVRNGTVETGRMKTTGPFNPAAPIEGYVIYGELDEDYAVAAADGSVRERLQGRMEWQAYDDFTGNSASILRREIESSAITEGVAEWTQGEPGSPLRVETGAIGSGRPPEFKFNGPYRYVSIECGTLEREITMPSIAKVNEEGSPYSGSLTITASDEIFTVTFDAQGAAIVDGPQGDRVSISVEEVLNALDAPPC